MTYNLIIIESDFEGNTFSSSKRGMESKSYSLYFDNGDFESGIISLIDDFKMEGVSGDFFS